MKKTINILPGQEKQELKWAQRSKILDFWFLRLLMLLLLLNIFLFTVVALISSRASSLKKEVETKNKELETSGFAELQKDVENLNQLIKSANQIEASQARVGSLADEVLSFLPGDIKLTSFLMDRTNKKVFLSGMSPARPTLLQLQENISRSQNFSNVELPLESLTQRENIEFKITFSFNAEN